MLKQGIYFHASDAYYKDTGLGSTAIREINSNPLEHWHLSPMNPKYKEPENKEAFVFGNMLHTLVLEPEEFYNRYAKPANEMPKYIGTATELKACLDSERLVYKKSTTKGALIDQFGVELTERGYTIDELYKLEVEKSGKVLCTSSQKELLDDMVGGLTSKQELFERHFQGGLKEVSIIIDDDSLGVRIRCRLDNFKYKSVTDLKTARDITNRKLYYGTEENGYNTQCGGYLYAIQQALKLKDKMATDDEEKLKEFWDYVGDGEDINFYFVFCEKKAPYDCRSIVVDEGSYSVGLDQWAAAISTYRQQLAKNGHSRWDSVYGQQPEALSNL